MFLTTLLQIIVVMIKPSTVDISDAVGAAIAGHINGNFMIAERTPINLKNSRDNAFLTGASRQFFGSLPESR